MTRGLENGRPGPKKPRKASGRSRACRRGRDGGGRTAGTPEGAAGGLAGRSSQRGQEVAPGHNGAARPGAGSGTGAVRDRAAAWWLTCTKGGETQWQVPRVPPAGPRLACRPLGSLQGGPRSFGHVRARPAPRESRVCTGGCQATLHTGATPGRRGRQVCQPWGTSRTLTHSEDSCRRGQPGQTPPSPSASLWVHVRLPSCRLSTWVFTVKGCGCDGQCQGAGGSAHPTRRPCGPDDTASVAPAALPAEPLPTPLLTTDGLGRGRGRGTQRPRLSSQFPGKLGGVFSGGDSTLPLTSYDPWGGQRAGERTQSPAISAQTPVLRTSKRTAGFCRVCDPNTRFRESLGLTPRRHVVPYHVSRTQHAMRLSCTPTRPLLYPILW